MAAPAEFIGSTIPSVAGGAGFIGSRLGELLVEVGEGDRGRHLSSVNGRIWPVSLEWVPIREEARTVPFSSTAPHDALA
jgi:hypothetical protein